MVSVLLNFWISFLAGLFAPLGAVCVLPLYPGFLSYLASQSEAKEKVVRFAWIITAGVIVSMFVIGLIFSYLLESSLTGAIGIISPIAFFILFIISLFMIFGFDFGGLIPKYNVGVVGGPALASFIFGLFFGAVVLPCNPASLVVLFAVSTSTMSFFVNLVNFILFGIGMAFPLIVFAYISSVSGKVIGYLAEHKRGINLIAGLIMLVISLYYLLFVFRIWEVFA
jgi:cytochrome c-type biogenesis protein